jgi:putative inorganic carbon (HCO3(-)) transporter
VTARLERYAPERLVWILGLWIGCAVLGAVAGLKPTYALAAAVGIVLVVATLANVTVGMVLFTIISFLEVLNSASGGATGVTKAFGLVVFVSWYARTLTTRHGVERWPRTHGAFLTLGVAFIGWSVLSAAWAVSSSTAISSTERYLLNLLLFPLVLGAVRRREHLLWLLGAFVLGAAISGLYGFVSSTGGGGRLLGGVGDANEEAAVLVAAIPIAIGLAVSIRDRPLLSALSWLSVPVLLAAILNTVSRGGVLALGVTLLAAVIFSGRWRTWATVVMLVVAVGTVGYFVGIAPYSAQQRITNTNSNGRSDLWKVGWSMVKDKPIGGVGSGNFQVAEPHYVQISGSLTEASLIIDQPHVAHNMYLEIAAELGIPGLVCFLGLVFASISAAVRATHRFRQVGDRDMELLARCLTLAIVAFMTADFFLSGEYSKQLWMTLALCPAALALARAERQSPLRARTR